MGIARLVLLAGAIFMSSCALAQVGQNEAIKDVNLTEIDSLGTALNADQTLMDAIESGRPYTSALQLDAVLSQFMDEERRKEAYGQVFRQIDLNTSPREELMLIPGLSSRMAHEFEEYRPYTSLEQFRREMGKYVDEDEVARLEQYVFIPLGLNSASSGDFMTIPGMSSRMVHEFEEYRPYVNMQQFRREIGKYVDEDEVARLESYVILD